MIQPPYGKPWLLYVLLGSSLALNIVMVVDRGRSDDGDADAAAEEVAAATDADAASPDAAAAAAPAAAPAAQPAALSGAGWRVTTAQVEHSLARTFQNAAGEDGDALAAAYARLFVWDLDLRRDLQKGDRVEVLWRPSAEDVIEIAAARMVSSKLGRTMEAWRYQSSTDSFPSYWQTDGTELPRRLVGGPLNDYQQITALLKDRPKHKGMDFKTPVGTPVVSPKSGVVTRDNWNHAANGNCLEVRFDDGVVTKLLHLSENKVKAGDRVAAGQVVALSGNTGRSTAPHLHYELHRGDQVLDPLDYHALEQRKLEGADLAAFREQSARLAATLDQALASL